MTLSAQTFFQWSDLVRAERIVVADDVADDDGHDDDDSQDDEVHADVYISRALEQALAFAARGWRIVPLYGIRQNNCTCKSRNECHRGAGKHPHFCVHNGLKGADNRAEEITRWFEKHTNLNVGIRTGEQWDGPSLFVVDIDTKIDPVTGKTALELLAELEAELGPLPRTHVVETGSGGLHIFLGYPKGLKIKSSQGKLGHGIDTKGENSYVVTSPSRHTSGGTYRIIRFDAGPPPMIPEAWLDRLKALGMVSNKSGLPTKREAAERAERDAEDAAARAANARTDDPGSEAICSMPQLPEGTVFDQKNRRDMGAFGRSMLTGSGQTNAAFIGLVCSLKNNPANISRRAKDFCGLFRWWYEENKQHMSQREWEQVWRRFEKAYDEWAEAETGPHWRARDLVVQNGDVQTAMCAKIPAKTLLASLYHALQEIMGPTADIWLSCDSGSDILKSLGFDLDRYQVNRLQRELRRDGVIQIQGKAVRGGWFAQRVRTAAAVLSVTLAKARKAVSVLLTPRQLLTLVGMEEERNTICVSAPPDGTGMDLLSVQIHPDDLAHAAQFLPPDVWRMSA